MTKTAPEISVGVVIPAAGAGRRLGGTRKQFRLLGDRPLLAHTAAVFNAHPSIEVIAIAVPPDDVTEIQELCRSNRLDKVRGVVAGGETRQDSVGAGIAALPGNIEIILTHDAVRPFISSDEITRLIDRVAEWGAAAFAAPVSDTLVRSKDGLAGETVPRDGVYRMLTPQGFRSSILRNAHRRAAGSNTTFTDEATLVMAAGHDVALVEGSPINIKITTGSDWELTRWMWPAWETR